MKISINYKYLFFLIITFYCIVLSQFGMENYDTGFLSSFSWRIVNGELPYRDFIYKFPPVSIYFHALMMKILPECGQFFYFRIFSYLMFALQIFFSVSGINNLYPLDKLKVDKWGLMSVCFIVSLLNFIPSPWPTTDGLLFVSIAFWLVSKYASIPITNLFGVAVFSVLCALCKQSFYLIPLLFTLWIYFRYGFRKSLVFLFFILILLTLFVFIINEIASIETYLKQTTGETKLYQLYYFGVYTFTFLSMKWVALLAITLVGLLYFYLQKTKKNLTDLKPILLGISVLLIVLSFLFIVTMNARIGSIIAFDCGVLALFYAYVIQKKTVTEVMPLVVLLGISWSVSISAGYPYPILYATGIIGTLLLIFKPELRIRPIYINTLAVLCCLSCFAYNLRPYREQSIDKLTYSLEDVSPKLKYIKTNKNNYEKHHELKKLINKYGENFVVAPSFPMANYLFNQQSELPADWMINTEVNRQYNRFIHLAAQKKNFIFLEKSFIEGEEFRAPEMKDFSYIAWYIHNHFQPVEETDYFIIYNSLKKHETLP